MGRHRHLTCVRSDGLSAVLRPLLDDRRIVAATLVDVDSGLILDGYVDDPGDHPGLADLELLGAAHADMVKAGTVVSASLAELTVSTDDGHHHLLHAVPDPHGERLVVAVVVRGAPRHVTRARLRLRTVSVEALTAGPTLARRPVDGSWVVEEPAPEDTAPEEDDDESAPADVPMPSGAPLSAMAPRSAAAPSADRTPSATVSSVASSLATGLSRGISSPLVPLSDARPGTARTGPAGR
ncbi:hypothetical protein EV188_108223 [Actinomycetospora succinea]|uniref:Uncharacterized protein n=1 Tax=Actinomycetospora succinea TaxID=663603 RepID=A0A4R6UWY5_9PSEU|nr:hypothetical protein [Actinomycetospora succinea]TDQ51862.1 hypothetical protein EV188_108223 [Actinomycetospora succinea]